MHNAGVYDLFRDLDGLFDELPLNNRRIDDILWKLSTALVEAMLRQRIEELTAPFMSQFNFIENEIRWRSEENPENPDLNRVRGRIEQIIVMIDIADNTALSSMAINTIKSDQIYLDILDSIKLAENQQSSLEAATWPHPIRESALAIKWLEERKLIVVDSGILRFGPKGLATLKAIRESN